MPQKMFTANLIEYIACIFPTTSEGNVIATTVPALT